MAVKKTGKASSTRPTSSLSAKDHSLLLELARTAITTCSSKTTKPIPDSLKIPQGVFVTLTENKDLRGCIGNIEPGKPLFQAVMDNAISAAYKDPRFDPVSEEEIAHIHIEISILSLPKKLDFADPKDLLAKLNHDLGVVLKKSYYTATFLPQVWELLPKKESFLSNLCMKAGLPSDAWKSPGIEIWVYTVEKFEEPKK